MIIILYGGLGIGAGRCGVSPLEGVAENAGGG